MSRKPHPPHQPYPGPAPSPAPAPAPPPGPPTFNGPKAAVGVNAFASAYYQRNLQMVNMLAGFVNQAQQNVWVGPGGVGVPTIGSDGWPTSDFATGFQVGPLGSPYAVTCQFLGKAVITYRFQRGATNLSSVSYNAGTNTSTFTFDYDPNSSNISPDFFFTNTQKTAVSATNTGVANIYFWRTVNVGNTTGTWGTDIASYYADFAVLRTMDLQTINTDNVTTDWASRSVDPCLMGRVENCIALGNTTGKDLWMQIPVNATTDWDTNFFTYALANLNSPRVLYFGYSNENWNSTFEQFFIILVNTATEMKGAVGGLSSAGRRILSIVGDGTTTTVTLDFTCDLSNGTNVAPTGFNSNVAFTVASHSGATFTFLSAFNGTVTMGTNVWYIDTDVVSTLRTYDNSINIYQLASRWGFRRLTQAAATCAGIVGGAFLTRFRPVIEEQMISSEGYGTLAYLSSLLGGDAQVPATIYAIAGAPYFNLNASAVGGVNTTCSSGNACPTLQVTDYLAAYTLTAATAKTRYGYARRSAAAIHYGVQSICYEGGPDNFFDAGTLNNTSKNSAKRTSGFGLSHLGFLSDVGMCRMALHMHYKADFDLPAGDSGNPTWGFTGTASDVTPFWQSFKTYNAQLTGFPYMNGLLATSTDIDARKMFPFYNSDQSAAAFPTFATTYLNGFWFNCDRLLYSVTALSQGTRSLTVTYKTLFAATRSFTIWVNGVQFGGTFNMPSVGVGNTGTVAVGAIPLTTGFNLIEIIRTVSQGADVQFNNLNFN